MDAERHTETDPPVPPEPMRDRDPDVDDLPTDVAPPAPMRNRDDEDGDD